MEMHKLLMTVELRYPAEACPCSPDIEMISRDLINECVYNEIELHGFASIRTALQRDVPLPGDVVLRLGVSLGITGRPYADFPSIETVTKTVYAYLALRLAGVIKQIDHIHAQFQPIQGLWEVFCLSTDAAQAVEHMPPLLATQSDTVLHEL